jgi:hypothetical protein
VRQTVIARARRGNITKGSRKEVSAKRKWKEGKKRPCIDRHIHFNSFIGRHDLGKANTSQGKAGTRMRVHDSLLEMGQERRTRFKPTHNFIHFHPHRASRINHFIRRFPLSACITSATFSSLYCATIAEYFESAQTTLNMTGISVRSVVLIYLGR